MRRETPLALYKGLGAVLSGIVPKMAIRFASFETYKGWLADKETGVTSVGNIFIGTLSFWAFRPCERISLASALLDEQPVSLLEPLRLSRSCVQWRW